MAESKYIIIWEHEPESCEYNQIMSTELTETTIVPPIGSKICVNDGIYVVTEVIVDYGKITDVVNVYCYKTMNENSNLKHFFAEKFKKITNP